jgi:hypothetical protein
MGPDLLRRVRWGNVALACAGLAALTVVVVWPLLATEPPRLPPDVGRPLVIEEGPEGRRGEDPASVADEPRKGGARGRRRDASGGRDRRAREGGRSRDRDAGKGDRAPRSERRRDRARRRDESERASRTRRRGAAKRRGAAGRDSEPGSGGRPGRGGEGPPRSHVERRGSAGAPRRAPRAGGAGGEFGFEG